MTYTPDIIRYIPAVEWRMFQNVKSAAPASCQSNPEAFGKIRTSVFEYWPEKMLHRLVIRNGFKNLE